MKILKWLSVADRFYKIYLDKQLAPFGVNSSQHMILLKICNSPGILQDSLINMFYIHPSNIVRTIAALEKQGMITRAPNHEDKRTWKLYPTDLALSAFEEIQTVCGENGDSFTARVQRRRKKALCRFSYAGREKYYGRTSYREKGGRI